VRIAIATEVFLPKIDGITNRLRHTVERLRRSGHEVLVIAPSGSVAEHAGARVVRCPALPFPLYPGLRAGLPDPRIPLELARFRPDVVHAVGPVCLGVWSMLAARALGLPLVASYHTDLPAYLPRYGLGFARALAWPALRALHNAAHVNLCPSQHTHRELEAHGVRNVSLWRGGVDTERFHPKRRDAALRARLSDGSPEAPLLLYVGRLGAEKSVDSLQALLAGLPQARLAIVGDGPERARLERLFGARRTVFAGFLRGDELAAAYASADVFVMPSTTETLGFVVLEAMSSGLPVVAANAGGVRDLVRDGSTGVLYDPRHPAEAIAAVRGLIADGTLRAAYGARARAVAETCGWRSETTRLLASYRHAIALAAAGRAPVREAGAAAD
jgi:glycosyltransferase involved in cell wall biosynthesis